MRQNESLNMSENVKMLFYFSAILRNVQISRYYGRKTPEGLQVSSVHTCPSGHLVPK